jgi:hypothetical protein
VNGPMMTWPGHDGEGDVAYAIGAAATPADRPGVMEKLLHAVTERAGKRQAGPVRWLWWPGEEGLRQIRAAGLEHEPDLPGFLAEHEAALVLVAAAPTDRFLNRSRKARQRGRRR